MRRHFIIFLCGFVAGTLGLMAQSMHVHESNVTYSYPYDLTSTMTFSTNTLTINGDQYNLSDIDRITGTADKVESGQVYVTYSGESATVTMSGELRSRILVSITRADVILTDNAQAEAGVELPEVTYHLSGTSSEGSFQQVGSYKSSVSLEGISLESSACPFAIDNGKRIDIILSEGSQNTFRDGSNNFRKSAFWIKGHAELSGAGTLNINGTQRHAYSSNEYTLLKNSFTGTINILGAAADGMHVEQYYEQRNGNVTFKNVEGDNLDVSATTEPTDEYNGQVIISGGTFTAEAAADDTKCIKNDTDMSISGGKLYLRCTGNGTKGLSVGNNLLIEQDVNAASNTLPYIYMLATGSEYVNPADATDTSKCRGIKVKGNFTFNGGLLERDLSSTIKAAKIISVDGTYTYKAGAFKNCSL